MKPQTLELYPQHELVEIESVVLGRCNPRAGKQLSEMLEMDA